MPVGFRGDWENGPLGPGFLLYFKGLTSFFSDGGGMEDFIEPEKITKEEEARQAEHVALILLMRCRC